MKLSRSSAVISLSLLLAGPAWSAACLSGSGDCQTMPDDPSALMNQSALPSQGTTLGYPQQGMPQNQQGQQNQQSRNFTPQMPMAPVSCDDVSGKLTLDKNSKYKTPALPLNDFQKYLCSSANLPLPIFGQQMFQMQQAAYSPFEAAPVSADYLIGVGDNFSVRLWGQLDADLQLKVDRSGAVFIPRVGNVSVVGIPFGALKQHLSREVGKVYRNFDLAVTMGQLKSVQVFVVGFAQNPGSYSLGSLSTVVNALFAAGGPSANGSLRKIQVKRAGKVVNEFDLYDLLLKGDKSHDLMLQGGDVVYVPPVGGQAAISGSVKVPAIYEVKPGENLQDLINWAGGAGNFAQDGKVSVERVVAQKSRKVESVELAKAAGFAVRGGDVVQLYGLSQKIDNMVSLRGNVAQSVRMPWFEGMKVSDLITSKEMLIAPRFWENKYQDKTASSKDLQEEEDQQFLLSQQSQVNQLRPQRKVDRTLLGALHSNQQEINWNYAAIERTNELDSTTTLVPFNLGAVILKRDASQDKLLAKGDVIHVFSKTDIRVSTQQKSRFVHIEGEVATPGIYQVSEGETLTTLIDRIGGLTSSAYLYGAEFSRDEVRKKQQDELERLADYVERNAQTSAGQQAQNALSGQGVQAANIQAEQQKLLAQKIRTTKADGRVVLGLSPESSKVADIPEVALEDGDRVFIPARSATVAVMGSVFSRNNAFIFSKNRSVGDYLALAGGPTESADSDSIFVVRADGSVVSAKQFGWISRSFNSVASLPGDVIVVPEKFDRTGFVKNALDWTQILANFGTGLAGIKVLGN
ncbi:SLBB domain-containing protein [Iodobacter fluviatilis]|uniref:Polysialic acid transport protein kpsD n=1 Tax=Iodobacter fluviatilis TaxID=537 RepID=A0A377STX0_9NEIS|nr:SLBB domain-containing protein [Iodobacter fluviatilis]TCU87970.1 protein involved in polysaccharide export with SLBB domain [Iodobacter fluviatilis]STR45471.1 Polysialic acid transport protein kpsD precursor [Iodobacter fluviatilis]